MDQGWFVSTIITLAFFSILIVPLSPSHLPTSPTYPCDFPPEYQPHKLAHFFPLLYDNPLSSTHPTKSTVLGHTTYKSVRSRNTS